MDQEINKKAYLYGIIVIVVVALLYAVWSLFLNRGTISFTAPPPFTVQANEQTTNCEQSPCDIVLAPGNYSFELTKQGYKPYSLQTNVPVLGTNQQNVEFIFTPIFKELGPESELQLFTEQQPAYSVYIERNRETGKQSLYYKAQEQAEEPVLATSFTRDLKQYFIEPAIENFNKIALIDVTETKSTLYLIDLTQKTRNAVLDIPLISGVKWLDENHLLLEGRTEQDNQSRLYDFDLTTQTLSPINIGTTLANVGLIDQNRLVAATNQQFTTAASQNPEGELVSLSPALESSPLIFVEYYLDSGNTRLFKSVDQPKSCSQIQVSIDGNSLLCLAPSALGDKVFELTFAE